MYCVPPTRNRPVTSRQPMSTDQKSPAASELTAWLEISKELPHHNPAHARITATSHKCSRLAQPQNRMYAGSHTTVQSRPTHRKTGNAFVPVVMRLLRLMLPLRHSVPQAVALACSVSTPALRGEQATEQFRQATHRSLRRAARRQVRGPGLAEKRQPRSI